jgi:hypothetical protein
MDRPEALERRAAVGNYFVHMAAVVVVDKPLFVVVERSDKDSADSSVASDFDSPFDLGIRRKERLEEACLAWASRDNPHQMASAFLVVEALACQASFLEVVRPRKEVDIGYSPVVANF